ncbi:hypothetical protein [Undibacterium terreum]|uniref:Uncharacterized protein n=1 Tax=Undibacterium terreum TaxID=1224302 RepID=A0A916V283_9BURK|nr:hypothetical protein [Undibacterium terreum]GGD00152.1 hypothetical protein GCM10011396_54590 [Undibacterium terreum]
MIANLITALADIIILALCLWAVLDKRVHTRFIGTLLLSCFGIWAFFSVLKVYWLGRPESALMAILNVLLAFVAAMIYLFWRDPRKKERLK